MPQLHSIANLRCHHFEPIGSSTGRHTLLWEGCPKFELCDLPNIWFLGKGHVTMISPSCEAGLVGFHILKNDSIVSLTWYATSGFFLVVTDNKMVYEIIFSACQLQLMWEQTIRNYWMMSSISGSGRRGQQGRYFLPLILFLPFSFCLEWQYFNYHLEFIFISYVIFWNSEVVFSSPH